MNTESSVILLSGKGTRTRTGIVHISLSTPTESSTVPICGSGENHNGSRSRSSRVLTDNPITCKRCLKILESDVYQIAGADNTPTPESAPEPEPTPDYSPLWALSRLRARMDAPAMPIEEIASRLQDDLYKVYIRPFNHEQAADFLRLQAPFQTKGAGNEHDITVWSIQHTPLGNAKTLTPFGQWVLLLIEYLEH